MKRILAVIIIGLVCSSTLSMLTPQAKSEPSETPLEVAEKAAVWVISQAIPEAGGYKWQWVGARGLIAYQSNVPSGSAGMGTFFLKLYEKTGNSTYLDYANGAAQWVITKAIPDSGGYKWASPDDDIPSPGWWLSSTVSGIGEFLLKMYKATGNSVYLDYAKGAAQWMIAMAYYEYGGCFIPYNPPGKYGSQAAHGIAPCRESYTVSFLLHLYQETGDPNYLTYVKGMAEWLISAPHIVTENGGYKWLCHYPYEHYYPIKTTAGVALYFYEIYQALGNETYLHYANGGVQWILSQAVIDGDGVKWPDRPDKPDYYLTVGDKLMHGLATISDVLLTGYSITDNATYLEYAKKHANWIIDQIPAGDAYVNALLYRFLSEIFNVVRDVAYSQHAEEALTWIINNATATNGGYKWRTLPYYPYFPTWFGGASGVGYHLISAPPIKPPEVPISATIDNDPDTLNLKSKGKWITYYIELPEGYNVGDIDVSSIRLNDTISVDPSAPVTIGDCDSDGKPDLMIKFDRASVISYVYNQGVRYGDVTLTITGKLNDGTSFEGSDIIKVTFPDVNNDRNVNILDLALIARALGTNSSCPHGTGWDEWNSEADINKDGIVDILDLAITGTNYGATIP